MAQGWIRAWDAETETALGEGFKSGKARSEFRRGVTAHLRANADAGAEVLATLSWGEEVELPDGLAGGDWTRAVARGHDGFLPTDHVVELAWVNEDEEDDKNRFVVDLDLGRGDSRELLWGDPVQILRRHGDTCRVRVRGMYGDLPARRLRSEPLLEVYFIDVGQGDGVLVRFPSGRHLLIDGGLRRSNQLTGKNAGDFVDWKFHVDYGHHTIRLDGFMASHCDSDHYGGLWDLVRLDAAENRELDCTGLSIGTFYHAGLSRWKDREDADPPHRNDLGPNDGEFFLRLLGDENDARAVLEGNSDELLAGWWKNFIEDLMERNPEATVERLGVRRESLQAGDDLPRMWPDEEKTDVRVLAPVTVDRAGSPALKDLGDQGQNTNGHSICLRLDHGGARILLTGDLNKNSMDWLMECYGEDGMGAWTSDAVKACHHGSADISYRFLDHLKAAATVISSGDAEGHAHPRPEVVAASAVTGRTEIDQDQDKLVTPLVYMTEIERSVSLGEVSRIEFSDLPLPGEDDEKLPHSALFAKPVEDISDSSLLTREDWETISEAPEDEREELVDDLRDEARQRLEELDADQRQAGTRARYFYRTIRSLFNIEFGERSIWRSRIMTRNHYGLVNVRTDGETVMCATMEEDESGAWTVHTFRARNGEA